MSFIVRVYMGAEFGKEGRLSSAANKSSSPAFSVRQPHLLEQQRFLAALYSVLV